MRFVDQIALVPLIEGFVSGSNLTRVATALQRQVTRNFGPIWNIEGTVDAFVRLDDVSEGYWPIIIVPPDFPVHALGFHLDELGQPFALVRFTDNWSLTASHECLEMLADPFGNRLVPSPSLPNDPTFRAEGLERVSYLVEICDPCESVDCAYTDIVNGVLISDFYTPRYFDPEPTSGVSYDFTGKITQPRQILKGGYLSWVEPQNNQIRQALWLDSQQPEFHDLGSFTGIRSLREAVDARTSLTPEAQGLPSNSKPLQDAQKKWKIVEGAAKSRSRRLQAHIQRIKDAQVVGKR